MFVWKENKSIDSNMAGKNWGPQSGRHRYKGIQEHSGRTCQLQGNHGVGTSGSLHLEAEARIRDATLDTT